MGESKEKKSYSSSIIDFSEYKKQKGLFYSENTNKTIHIIWPTDFDDSQLILEEMLKKNTIIINLYGMEKIFAQRLMDFICGACYALNYTICSVSNNIFIIGYYYIEQNSRELSQPL